jgi:RNA polymerase sigma-70 factor (ECF subfamily)
MSATPDDLGVPIDELLHHRAWLRALSRKLVGPGLADDLVQETWLAALRRPPERGRPAQPWLAAVARRIAGRLLGARGATAPGGDPQGDAPSSAELLARLETEARLAREVAALDEPFRRTVLLRYHEGLSAAEIARRDGVPAGTVRWRLKRGLDALRARLDRDYGDRRSWAVVLASLAGVEVGAGVGALAGKAAAVAAVVALAAGGGALWRARAAGPELELEAAAARDRAEIVAAPDAERRRAPEGMDAPEAETLALAAEPAAGARVPAAVDATAGPYPVRLAVSGADGAPAADLLVLVRRRAELGELAFDPQEARTGPDGRAELAIDELHPIDVAIARPSGPAHVLALEPGEPGGPGGPELVVAMPAGARLAGRVRVDGAAPARSIEVEIYPSDEAADVYWAEDAGVRRSYLFHGMGPVTATTGADGRFAFTGLPDDWHGTLRLEPGFAPVGALGTSTPHGRVKYFVPAPADDLVLDVEAFPALRGRIVEADGATPVPDGSIGATVTWADANGEMAEVGARTDPDGRFALHLAPRPVARVELHWRAIPDRGRAERVLTGSALPAPAGDLELGDLPLAVGRDVLLRFVDAAGAPIEGALVAGRDAASDAGGEILITGVAPADAAVRAAAFGYDSRVVDLPAGADEVEVELARANRLDVLVLDAAGAPMQGCTVELAADGGALFVSKGGMIPEEMTRESYPGQLSMAWGGPDRYYVQFRTDRDGRFATGGLRAGVELDLVVPDECGGAFHAERLAPLGAGEHRAVEVRWTNPPRTLAVRVVERSGAPIEGAQVRLASVEGPDSWRTRSRGKTDATGRAAWRRLADDAYLVGAEMRGYVRVPAALVPALVGEGGGEHVVVLEPGLDVAVRVQDPAGQPVAGGVVTVPAPEGGATPRRAAEPSAEAFEESAPGRFVLDGLPDAPLDVTLELAGATYVARCDPRVSELVFDVPAHGAVEAEWTPPAGAGSDDATLVLLRQDGTLAPRRVAIERAPHTRRFAPVLPGAYVAVVRADDDGDSQAELGDEQRDLSARVPVEVRAGETTHVVLPPR